MNKDTAATKNLCPSGIVPAHVANKPLCLAALGRWQGQIPLWMMRQAGRYLPEYRAIRERYNTLQMFRTPALAADITLQPLARFPLDAAIVYADILLIPDALGCGLGFVAGEGPRFASPVRTEADVARIEAAVAHPEDVLERLDYVFKTLGLVAPALAPHQALIGFAGAPWTVASYVIEGGGTAGDCFESKCFLLKRPDLMHRLLAALTDITICYLERQVDAGCEVLQLFESWGGALAPAQYRTFAAPYAARILQTLSQRVPCIHYVGESAGILQDAVAASSHCFSVDWRQELGTASRVVTGARSLQGNLDPVLLCGANSADLRAAVEAVCQVGTSHSGGFIFNLGHGLRQQTPVEQVGQVCTWVKEYTPRI